MTTDKVRRTVAGCMLIAVFAYLGVQGWRRPFDYSLSALVQLVAIVVMFAADLYFGISLNAERRRRMQLSALVLGVFYILAARYWRQQKAGPFSISAILLILYILAVYAVGLSRRPRLPRWLQGPTGSDGAS
jgi:hypothetical protein